MSDLFRVFDSLKVVPLLAFYAGLELDLPLDFEVFLFLVFLSFALDLALEVVEERSSIAGAVCLALPNDLLVVLHARLHVPNDAGKAFYLQGEGRKETLRLAFLSQYFS